MIKNKNIFITGGNSGIGFFAIINLLKTKNILYVVIKNEFRKNEFLKKIEKYFDKNYLSKFLNIIENCDLSDLENIKKINIRFQKIDDLPFKELRRLVDQGKKDIKEGIVVIYAIKDDKIGLAVGVTDSLTKNYDAIKFVKSGSEILGGKGGGGRSDFAKLVEFIQIK